MSNTESANGKTESNPLGLEIKVELSGDFFLKRKEESMLSKFHYILKNRFGWYGELHDAIDELPTSREFEQATLDLLAQDNPYCECFMQKAFDFNQNPAILKRGLESEHAETRAKAFELLNSLTYEGRLNALRSWLIVRE